VVAAVACFATLDTTTKLVSGSVPLLMALWFRYCFQAVVTTATVLPRRGWGVLKTAHPRFQLLRGLLLLISSLLAFICLTFLPVAEFTAMGALVPLTITLLAATVVGERVSPLRWALVLGGFAGALVIIRPGSDNYSWAMLIPLVMVGTYSWFQVLTSRLVKTEDPITMHLYTGWVGTLVASLILPFVWTQLSWSLWAHLLLMGAMATIGHFLLILAYTRAPAATLTPYLYAQIGFAMLGGWLMFSHVPDRWSLIGMGMIALCGVAGAWLTARESRVWRDVPVRPVES
jgi:drug/metabolite transporter (DMT)-like permease